MNLNYVELIKIGNWAKDVGEYEIANEVFAVLLQEYFSMSEKERNNTEGGPPNLCLILETQDEIGEYPPEVYYDLLVIEAYKYFEESGGYRIHDLCIPVPLIQFQAMVTAMKAASVVERKQHERECREAEENEIQEIRQELLTIIDEATIEEAKSYILDLDAVEE